MVYKKIIECANRFRGRYDHIGWRGVCKRCGLERNVFGEEIKKFYGDPYEDLREREIPCNSPRCDRIIKILGKMPAERAIHLHDIKRRKSSLYGNN